MGTCMEECNQTHVAHFAACFLILRWELCKDGKVLMLLHSFQRSRMMKDFCRLLYWNWFVWSVGTVSSVSWKDLPCARICPDMTRLQFMSSMMTTWPGPLCVLEGWEILSRVIVSLVHSDHRMCSWCSNDKLTAILSTTRSSPSHSKYANITDFPL